MSIWIRGPLEFDYPEALWLAEGQPANNSSRRGRKAGEEHAQAENTFRTPDSNFSKEIRKLGACISEPCFFWGTKNQVPGLFG